MIARSEIIAHLNEVWDRQVPVILTRQDQFLTCEAFLRRYRDYADRCAEPTLAIDFQQMNSFANELCAARAILDNCGQDAILQYEPQLTKTPKSIDFRVDYPDAKHVYIDVKTIDPEWIDDDNVRRRQERSEKHMPANVMLITDAAAHHQLTSSREKFLLYALELEEKIELLTDDERGQYRLLFCGNGTSWRRSDLEDFADFYRRNRHRDDDAFRAMEQYSMGQKGVQLKRTIDGLCFLFRYNLTSDIASIGVDVRGPIPGSQPIQAPRA